MLSTSGERALAVQDHRLLTWLLISTSSNQQSKLTPFLSTWKKGIFFKVRILFQLQQILEINSEIKLWIMHSSDLRNGARDTRTRDPEKTRVSFLRGLKQQLLISQNHSTWRPGRIHSAMVREQVRAESRGVVVPPSTPPLRNAQLN